MQKSGNTDELIRKLQERNSKLEADLLAKDKQYAFATLGSQFKTEAARMGCQDPDSLLKIMDITDIPVDPETFTANGDAVKVRLSETKKTMPYFFGKEAPTVQDVDQQNVVLNKPAADFTKMTREELDAYIKEHGHKL